MYKKFYDLIFIFFTTFIILGISFFSKSGTYFLLDGVFPPIYEMKHFFDVSIFWHINNFLTLFLGYAFYSKIFLFFLIFFTGILGLKLSYLISNYMIIPEKYKNILAYISVLFFLLNPFFYERTITQPGISLGFLFIGFGLYFLLKDIINGNRKQNFFYTGILFGFSFSIMSHSLFLVLFIYLSYFIFFVRSKKLVFYTLLSIFLFFLINTNWLFGNLFLNTGNTIAYVNSIDSTNIENFVTNGIDDLGPEITTLLLYGFWGEKWGHFILPSTINTNWYIAGIFILFIILFGLIKSFRNKNSRKLSLFLLFIGLVSYILGVGIIAKWGFISQFLYDYLPYYVGLREPQKWIGLLAFVYAIFFIYGVYGILIFFDKYNYIRYISIFLIFLFLNAWNPNTIFGFNHQLFITDFPKQYFDFRKYELKYNYKENKYLILPWHSYMSCDYTNRVVANVMDQFFKPLKTSISDNIEVGSLYTNSTNTLSKDVEQFIINSDITLLKNNKFSHIIILNTCGDFANYNTKLQNLENKKFIKKQSSNDKISIYKIQ